MDNYIKEKDIVKEVLKRAGSDWDNDQNELIMRYLNPYIQDGFDVLVDDGYLLYLSDVRNEMTNYVYSFMSNNDYLKLAVSNVFQDEARKEKISNNVYEILKDKYTNYAPTPKRDVSEYIQFSNCKKIQDEFEACYHGYVKAIDELKDFTLNFLEVINSSMKVSENEISALTTFVDKLERLKNKDFYKSLTYGSNIPATDLFYQEVFLSEDAERLFNDVKEKILHFQLPKTKEFSNYSLDDIYAAIPKDIISYELLENEEIDPNHIVYNSPFVQKFCYLAKSLVKDAENDENFEDTVYSFLIKKITDFQEEFFNYYEPDDDESINDNDFEAIEAFTYSKRDNFSGRNN